MSTQSSQHRSNRRAEWETWYRTLKSVEPDAYRKAIGYSEAIALNFNLDTKVAAEVEFSHVMLACELLGVSP